MDWCLNSNKQQRKKANIEHLLLQDEYFAYIISLSFKRAIRSKSYYELHFKDGKIEP